MNQTMITVLWTILGIAAFIELARVYYRLHMAEENIIKCIGLVEEILKSAKR